MSQSLPTAKELWDLYVEDELEELEESVDPDDYTNIITRVLKIPDGRLVEITYEADGRGDNNSWRDSPESIDVEEVEAYTVTTTAYRKKGTA